MAPQATFRQSGSPYRTPPEVEPKPDEKLFGSPPYFVIGLLVLAGFRVIVAIVTKETCGADVGIATIVAALAARSLVSS